MNKIAFILKYGYEIHIFFLLLVIITLIFSIILKTNYKYIFSTICRIIIQTHFVILLTEILSNIHLICWTMGDNLLLGNNLLKRVQFEGWCIYLILFIVVLLLWILSYRKKVCTLSKRYTIIPFLLCIISLMLKCYRIITYMTEYTALECDFDLTYKIIYNISNSLFGDGHHIYYATNVIIPISLTIYTTMAIAINVPRLEVTPRLKHLRFLRGLNKVTIILIIYYSLFIRSALVLFPFLIINILLCKNIDLLYKDFSNSTWENKTNCIS